ncbi:MAG: hypothetical protein A3I66_05695 [Burkholderiales bacterium RIFCSPLOWO2_02_FULL_57_36]|nr:MAG: hypothetical protein A3I66_05695 [Burkholderiales bacterium RIFCSPLOWO2_02_FULL_57_36]
MQKPSRPNYPVSSIDALQNNPPATAVWKTHDFDALGASSKTRKGKVMDIECDGSKTLLEQQTAINYTEQTNSIQLVCYQKGRFSKNSATVKQVPKGQTILPLLLLELPASISVGFEVASQLAAGRHLVFYTAVYVKGIETKVAGFR